MQNIINIKVDQATSGWGPSWVAYDKDCGLDYEWDGDSWKSCGSKIGEGRTIQEAIEDYIEQLNTIEKIKYTWS